MNIIQLKNQLLAEHILKNSGLGNHLEKIVRNIEIDLEGKYATTCKDENDLNIYSGYVTSEYVVVHTHKIDCSLKHKLTNTEKEFLLNIAIDGELSFSVERYSEPWRQNWHTNVYLPTTSTDERTERTEVELQIEIIDIEARQMSAAAMIVD